MSADGERLFTLRVPKDVADTLFRFARSPVTFVGSIISAYIVNAVFGVGAFAVNSVLTAFGIVTGFFDGIRVVLVNAFGSVGIDIASFADSFWQDIAGVIANAGAAAPILAVGITAVAVYVGWQLLKRTPKALWYVYQLIPGT